jgi:hypothetical protein
VSLLLCIDLLPVRFCDTWIRLLQKRTHKKKKKKKIAGVELLFVGIPDFEILEKMQKMSFHLMGI